MTKINFRSCLPYAIALIYIYPDRLYLCFTCFGRENHQSSGYFLLPGELQKKRDDYKKQTGEESFWTNSMFSGMPTTMIGAHYKGNYLETIYNHLFWGPRPASYLILTFVSFFFCCCLRWESMSGSLLSELWPSVYVPITFKSCKWGTIRKW